MTFPRPCGVPPGVGPETMVRTTSGSPGSRRRDAPRDGPDADDPPRPRRRWGYESRGECRGSRSSRPTDGRNPPGDPQVPVTRAPSPTKPRRRDPLHAPPGLSWDRVCRGNYFLVFQKVTSLDLSLGPPPPHTRVTRAPDLLGWSLRNWRGSVPLEVPSSDGPYRGWAKSDHDHSPGHRDPSGNTTDGEVGDTPGTEGTRDPVPFSWTPPLPTGTWVKGVIRSRKVQRPLEWTTSVEGAPSAPSLPRNQGRRRGGSCVGWTGRPGQEVSEGYDTTPRPPRSEIDQDPAYVRGRPGWEDSSDVDPPHPSSEGPEAAPENRTPRSAGSLPPKERTPITGGLGPGVGEWGGHSSRVWVRGDTSEDPVVRHLCNHRTGSCSVETYFGSQERHGP